MSQFHWSKPANVEHPQREPAAEVAKILGGGLVQVIVTGTTPIEAFVFLNGTPVDPADFGGLFVEIDASNVDSPILQAFLTRTVETVAGTRDTQRLPIFPCSLDLVVKGKRIQVDCPNANSLDGLTILLGVKPDGSSTEVQGARTMRIVIESDVLDAHLTWTDGAEEDLLPE
jgi:hypothetical protein